MAEIPFFIVAERWAHIDILEQVEAGEGNGQVVLDSVLPVGHKIFFEDLFFLCRDGVPHVCRIAESELVIPFRGSFPIFEFQGVNLSHAEGHLRHRKRKGRVRGILRMAQISRHVERCVFPPFRIGNAGRFLGAQVTFGRQGILFVITAGREIDICAERPVGIGLGILAVRPHHLELWRPGIGIQSSFSIYIHGIPEIKSAVKPVSHAVIGMQLGGPGTPGVDISPGRHVEIIVGRPVVSPLTEEKSAVSLFSV